MSISPDASSLRSLLGDLGILGEVGNSILQITQQEQCLMSYVGTLMEKYTNSTRNYVIRSSLISPFEFRNAIFLNNPEQVFSYYNNISHLVRHGILVRTTIKGENSLVFIGGFDSAWERDVVTFKAYNGGNAYKAKFSVSSNILPGLHSKETGLAVIPFGGGGAKNWYNFERPAQRVCREMVERTGMQMMLDDLYQSLWQRIVGAFTQGGATLSKYMSVFGFGGISNYVPYMQELLWPPYFEYHVPSNSVILHNPVANYWEINTEITNTLESIPGYNPAITPGIIMLRELDDILQRPTIITFPDSPSSLIYPLSNRLRYSLEIGYEEVKRLGLINNSPIITGSPVLGAQICTTECENSQGLIGFVGNSLPSLPLPAQARQFPPAVSLLVPPPNSYRWRDIVAWARSFNIDINKLNLVADAVVIISQAVKKVAQEQGMAEEEVYDYASEVEIGEEVLSKGVENIATEIVNFINSF